MVGFLLDVKLGESLRERLQLPRRHRGAGAAECLSRSLSAELSSFGEIVFCIGIQHETHVVRLGKEIQVLPAFGAPKAS